MSDKLKGIVVGVRLDNIEEEKFNNEMEELVRLANACDIEILDNITQTLPMFFNKTYVGKGKVDEIKQISEALEVDVVIFNDELTPVQISNLDQLIEKTIYDRTYLILEIFKSRARTREAIIQVEMASLSYMLPRLAGLRKGLSRQRGAGGGFAHGRGAGETKLELDRRITNDKIASLKAELKELAKKRKQQRIKRNSSIIKTVCLVGYTNSGKSSLMNNLLKSSITYQKEKEVFQKDMLFATLETSTRRINMIDGNFILTDTVGFIEKLPHMLIEAFKSTLEEIHDADLLIHVVDSSNPKFLDQIKATNNVLKELNVSDIPVIYAFNKIDKVEGYLYIPNEYPEAIKISVKENININLLVKTIIKNLYNDYQDVTFVIPYAQQNIFYKIKELVINPIVDYDDQNVILKCKASQNVINQYAEFK